jgi:broad specificity phosphatase PhoE
MSSSEPERGQAVLVRHADTEWSLSGRHTGRTDLPLTESGREKARALAPILATRRFELVLVSPLRRAVETCELCGLGAQAQLRPALEEWDYGEYEGLTTAQIREQRPGWDLWRDGCPGGEDAAAVGVRADRVVAELETAGVQAAVFAHGHVLRVLGARWITQDAALGGRIALSTGGLCVLGYEHETSVLARWNSTRLD